MFSAIIILIFATFLAFAYSRCGFKPGLVLSSIIITAFLSLGYNWGNDVPEYQNIYEEINAGGLSAFDFKNFVLLGLRYEYGWIVLNILFRPIGFWWMRCVLFVFENYVVYRFIVRHVPRRNCWVAVLLYCLNPSFMVMSSSMMRQWLAMCVFILALEKLENKKMFPFFLLSLLAFSFHKCAILCFAVSIFFWGTPKLNLKRALIVAPFFIAYFIFPTLIWDNIIPVLTVGDFDYYSRYLGSDAESGFGITRLFFIALYSYMYYKASSLSTGTRVYFAVLCMYLITAPLSIYGQLTSRLSLYFTLMFVICFPIFLSLRNVTTTTKTILTCMVVVLEAYSFFTFFASDVWKASYLHYHTLIGPVI